MVYCTTSSNIADGMIVTLQENHDIQDMMNHVELSSGNIYGVAIGTQLNELVNINTETSGNVLVTTNNGNIQIGDLLGVSQTTLGYAAKYSQGDVLGRASRSCEEDKIIISFTN